MANYTLAVDENLAGAIPFLEFSGRAVLRPTRGMTDINIHQLLSIEAKEPDRQIVFFTRDGGFLKHTDRNYFLYYISLPPQSAMDQARLILTILEQDFPKRTEPKFEVTIRHIFRKIDATSAVVEIESAIP